MFEDFIIDGKCDAVDGPIKILNNVKTVENNTRGFVALSNNGDTYVWGELGGLVGKGEITTKPQKYLSNIKGIDVSNNNCYFIKQDGGLWKISLLRLEGKTPIFSKLTKVYSHVSQVAEKAFGNQLILLENGTVLSTGTNCYGELGIGTKSDGIWNKYVYVKGFKIKAN